MIPRSRRSLSKTKASVEVTMQAPRQTGGDQTSETVFIILQKCKDTGGRGAVQGNEVIREGLVGDVCGFRVIATLAP